MELKGKTALVTGATGLIGSNLVNRLLNENVRVIANARSYDRLASVFSDQLSNENLVFLIQDISKVIILDEKVDVVFHAASPQENEIIFNRPLEVVFPNILGTINCFELIMLQKRQFNVNTRMVIFSSVTIYKNFTNKDIEVSESDTSVAEFLCKPSAAYSESKRMAEVIANGYFKQYFIDVVIGRLSTVYGDTRLKTNTAFFNFINSVICGNDITVLNPKAPKRDNIFIDDAVDGLLKMVCHGRAGEVYNISSGNMKGNFASVYDIAARIVSIGNGIRQRNGLGQIRLITPNGFDGASQLGGVIMNNSKLASLGWNLESGLDEGIESTLRKHFSI
jgi:UDP-glucuronate decarboxylase